MSSVVVLGGTGFVGPYIVSQLVNRGDDVVLFHRGHREPPLTKGAEHVHGEFERLPEYIAELSRREPDVVIDVSPGLGKGGHGAMSVLWGVQDAVQGMPVTEDSELRTGPSPDLTEDLAFDNLTVEQAVAAADFPVTVLRCPVIYGPLDTQRRLRSYVRQMLDKRPAIVLDARLARLRMSRGYVENVAQAAVLATSNDRATGRTYNVGEVDALSEADWVREIAAALGWDGEVVADPEGPPPAQDIYADTSRIRAELGYVESISRPEGLRRAVEWERAQPN